MNLDELHLHWLCFAGAPLLVIPQKSTHKWFGMMSPYDEKVNIAIHPFDIEEINGKKYYLNEKMDFDSPQTHYEEICHKLQTQERPYFLFRVDEVNCLIFDSWGDGFAWWDEEHILFNGLTGFQDLREIQWMDPIEYTVQDSELVFMNSAAHGADPYLGVDDYQRVTLARGTYRIERAEGEFERVFRFTRC